MENTNTVTVQIKNNETTKRVVLDLQDCIDPRSDYQFRNCPSLFIIKRTLEKNGHMVGMYGESWISILKEERAVETAAQIQDRWATQYMAACA
jgi:hypothetical protein